MNNDDCGVGGIGLWDWAGFVPNSFLWERDYASYAYLGSKR